MENSIDLINLALAKDLEVGFEEFNRVMNSYPIDITQPIINLLLAGNYEDAKREFNSLI